MNQLHPREEQHRQGSHSARPLTHRSSWRGESKSRGTTAATQHTCMPPRKVVVQSGATHIMSDAMICIQWVHAATPLIHRHRQTCTKLRSTPSVCGSTPQYMSQYNVPQPSHIVARGEVQCGRGVGFMPKHETHVRHCMHEHKCRWACMHAGGCIRRQDPYFNPCSG